MGGKIPHDGRSERRSSAKRVATVMTWSTFALCAWLIFPDRYGIAIACVALLPWIAVAIAWRAPGQYRVYASATDRHPNLWLAVNLPAFALLFPALADGKILDFWKSFEFGVAGAAVCGLIFAAALQELRTSPWGVLGVSFIMLFYAWAVVLLANEKLDRTAPLKYATRVLDMRISDGKHRIYYLDVEPWGPRAAHGEVPVKNTFYSQVRVGDTVCIYLWAGALNVRWYQVLDCPKTG